MQRTTIRTVPVLLIVIFLLSAALPVHALLGWGEHKIEKWNNKTYYLLGLVGNAIGNTFCSSNSQAVTPDVMLSDYGPQLVRWYGGSYLFVAATMARHTDGRYVYNLACRDTASGKDVQVSIVFEYTRDGLLESLTFDRDLAPVPGFGIRRGTPVAVETVVRALRMSARAVRADAGGMEVKKLKTKVSVKKAAAEKLRGIQVVCGAVPTTHADFNSVGTFEIGVFDPEDTNRIFNTFSCSADGIYGRNNNKFVCSFLLEPDPGVGRPVAQFKARLRKGQIKYVYKFWYVNPQMVLIDQASYDSGRAMLKANPPTKAVSYYGVHFAMDGDVYEVPDVPVLVRTKKSGASMRKVKVLNLPE